MVNVKNATETARHTLERLKYRKIGNGAYGSVHLLPKSPDKVLKLCCDPSDGWPVYANWLMREAPACAMAPHIYSMNIRPGRTMATMEKLLPFEFDWLGDPAEHCLKAAGKAVRAKRFLYGFERDSEDLRETLGNESVDFLIDLGKLKNRHPMLRLDLHAGNWMMRPGTDDAVLVDPFAGDDVSQPRLPTGRFKSPVAAFKEAA